MSKLHAPRANEIGPITTGSAEQNAYMDDIERLFTIDTDYLIKIKDHFLKEMEKGLNYDKQTLAMIPSFVEGRLTGKEGTNVGEGWIARTKGVCLIGQEKGHYLALDLGGTNLRVVLVTLEGQGKFKTISTKARVSEDLKTGPMRNLCGKNLMILLPTVVANSGVRIEYIADCIDKFLTEQGLENSEEHLPLGFTFSFPVLQSKVGTPPP